MGKRGPQPKHESIKIANGTFRPSRDGSLPAPAGEPDPPSWLDENALKVWVDVVGQLSQTPGLLAHVDGFSLGRYCQDWCEYWTLLEVIQTEGYTVQSDAGNLYQHPAVGAKNKAADRLSRFEARFGMTPSDRVGLRVTNKPAGGVRRRQA